jgi:predicted kinase
MNSFTIFFFRGLPASGKSTRRREMLADPSLQPITYTNKDEIRKQILVELNEPWSKKVEKLVERRETEMVEAACIAGQNLIIDNTHGSPRHEHRYRSIANRYHCAMKVVDFDTPLEECIRRDRERGADSVGETVIRQMHRQNFVKPYVGDLSLPPTIIVDLDGTLAQISDRGWFEYSKCETDTVAQHVLILINAMLKSGAVEHVLFVTGRDETGREATERWLLKDCNLPVDGKQIRLFMKVAGDNTPDYSTKHKTFEEEIRLFYRILFVLEDRKRVVEMWRELGVPCFAVAEKED